MIFHHDIQLARDTAKAFMHDCSGFDSASFELAQTTPMHHFQQDLEGKDFSVPVSKQIHQSIRKAILSGRFSPGEKLPSEESLGQEFHVSKTAVREALGHLVAEGLIEKRRGAMGGSFVSQGNSQRILEVVMDCYRLGGLTLEEVMQFRRLVEPVVAGLACQNRTAEDLHILEKNLSECRQALSEGWVNRAKQVAFHGLLAKAGHNRLLSASVMAAINISREFTSKINFPYADGELDLVYNERFYQCLQERDTENARKYMNEHFDKSRILVERYRRHLQEEPQSD